LCYFIYPFPWLVDLSTTDRNKIGGLGRAAASALQIHRTLMAHPIATSGWLVEKTGITPATVNKALGHLERLGIVKGLSVRKRNRLFSYAGYIETLIAAQICRTIRRCREIR